MEVYGIRLLTGHRISEEVFNELADLAPNYSKNILGKLFNSPLGGFSPGVLSYSADTPNFELSINGSNIQVSGGIVVFPDGLLVDVPDYFSGQLPDVNNSYYIYLVYQLVDDNNYTSHDFKGVIDYPLKKVELSLDFVLSSGGGPQPIAGATNRIRLGYYNSITGEVSHHGRQYAIITSGLLWPGDNDGNINSFLDLTPSVEPGTSLWQFLASKGSGERTVRNPFGLTFDDIQGELYSDLQSVLLFNGVVANPKGINGDVPLRLTVDANNTYQINLNVNQDGSYYGISDSEQEGIILVNGHWFKHIDKNKLDTLYWDVGYYLIYLKDEGLDFLVVRYDKFNTLNDVDTYVNTLSKRGSILPLGVVYRSNSSPFVSVIKEYTRDGVLSTDYVVFDADKNRFNGLDVLEHTASDNKARNNRNINDILNYYYARRLGVSGSDTEVIGLRYIFTNTNGWNGSDVIPPFTLIRNDAVAIAGSGSSPSHIVITSNNIQISDSPSISIGSGKIEIGWFSFRYDQNTDKFYAEDVNDGLIFTIDKGDGKVVYGDVRNGSVKGYKSEFKSNVSVKANVSGLPYLVGDAVVSEGGLPDSVLLSNYIFGNSIGLDSNGFTGGAKNNYRSKWIRISDDKYYLAFVCVDTDEKPYLFIYEVNVNDSGISFEEVFGYISLGMVSSPNARFVDFDIYGEENFIIIAFINTERGALLVYTYNKVGSTWDPPRYNIYSLGISGEFPIFNGTGIKIMKLDDNNYRIFYMFNDMITDSNNKFRASQLYIKVSDYNLQSMNFKAVLDKSFNIFPPQPNPVFPFGSNSGNLLLVDGDLFITYSILSPTYSGNSEVSDLVLHNYFVINDILGSPSLDIDDTIPLYFLALRRYTMDVLYDDQNVNSTTLVNGFLPFNHIKKRRKILFYYSLGVLNNYTDFGFGLYLYPYMSNQDSRAHDNYAQILFSSSGVDYQEIKTLNDIRFLVPKSGWGVIFPTDLVNSDLPHVIGERLYSGENLVDVVFKDGNYRIRRLNLYNDSGNINYSYKENILEWDD